MYKVISFIALANFVTDKVPEKSIQLNLAFELTKNLKYSFKNASFNLYIR